MVLCHGCFDILHPGHVLSLQSAREQGDCLVVSITSDDAIEKDDAYRPAIPQEHRALALAALSCVDYVVVVPHATAQPILSALQPDIYVKGKEYEGSDDPRFGAEAEQVRAGGGTVVFTEGSVVYSSSALLKKLTHARMPRVQHLRLLAERWDVQPDTLPHVMEQVRGQRIAVVGDTLLDRYTIGNFRASDPDAALHGFTPEHHADYPGGAAVVALHLAAMGMQPVLLTAMDCDAPSQALTRTLEEAGVDVRAVPRAAGLPIKQRFIVQGQTVFKVDHGIRQELTCEAARELTRLLITERFQSAVFTDFGLGVTSPALLESTLATLRHRGTFLAGDVSGQRQTLRHFHRFDLITPTHTELRAGSGLPSMAALPDHAMALMRHLNIQHLIATHGPRGLIAFHPRQTCSPSLRSHRPCADALPSFIRSAKDPTGAGDALLAMTTAARLAGLALPAAAMLGSAAAAAAVEHVGNAPIDPQAMKQRLAQCLGSRQTVAA